MHGLALASPCPCRARAGRMPEPADEDDANELVSFTRGVNDTVKEKVCVCGGGDALHARSTTRSGEWVGGWG